MEYQVILHTDHFQFFVADEQYQTNTAAIWTEEALHRQVACGADLVAVGTVRYGGETKVMVRFDDWHDVPDHVKAGDTPWCEITVSSGIVALFAPESDFATCPRIPVPPGRYRVFVIVQHGDRVADELAASGDDQYLIIFTRVS